MIHITEPTYATVVAGVALLICTGCKADYPIAPTDSGRTVALEIHYPTSMADPRVGFSFSYRLFRIDIDGAYEDVTAAARWYSADPTVVRAAPGESATLLAVGPGSTDVLATFDGLTTSIPTFVRPAHEPYPYIEIPSFTSLLKGSFSRHDAYLRTGPTQRVDITLAATWTSLNPNVARIGTASAFERQRIEAGQVGAARIVVSYQGLSAGLGISVLPPSGGGGF